MSKSAAAAAPVVELIPLDRIHESPSNPRKTFTGIEELAEDVKARGILQPVLVRGNADGYELVFGARRYRAAKLAKLPALPAFVRALTDVEVLEIQIVENCQRSDIHPLEEGDGYRQLHEQHHLSVDEIAAKVGKSRSAVYERIKLCALVPAAREAFLGGKLSASTALLVARIPDKELQGKAVKDLVGHRGDEPMSYRQAVAHVQQTYMLQLKDAPFSLTDAELVPKAGACSACPKRTGNQRELFADVKSPDVCTDPACHGEKVEAVWQLKVAKAKESGQEVLDEKKAKELFKYGGLDYSAGLRKLDDEEWIGNTRKSLKQILGKDAPPPILARDPATGKIHELVKREAVQKALRGDGQPQSQADKARREKERREREAGEAKDKLRTAVTRGIVVEVVNRVEARQMSRALWLILAQQLADDALIYNTADEIVERRTGKSPNNDDAAIDLFEGSIPKMSEGQLRGLVFELALAGGDAFHSLYRREKDGPISQAARALGVDEKKVEARIKAERNKPASPPVTVQGCAIPGCGQPGKCTKGAPGLWCADHGKKLSAVEKKSIDARNKRLAAAAPMKKTKKK